MHVDQERIVDDATQAAIDARDSVGALVPDACQGAHPVRIQRIRPNASPKERRCRWCGGSGLTDRRAVFCSARCRKEFNKHRYKSSPIYRDLYMCLRYERDRATRERVQTLLSRVAAADHDEDVRKRGGRKSYRDVVEIVAAEPWLLSDRWQRQSPNKR